MTGKRSPSRVVLEWLAGWQVIPVGCLALILVFPTHFSPLLVALALLAIPGLWLLHRLACGRFFTPTPVDIPILILLATLVVGTWAATLTDLAVLQVIKYSIAVALFYALVNTLTTERKVELASWAVLAGTALLAGVSVLGMSREGGPKFLPTDLAVGNIPRLISAFWNPQGFHPNIVGGILAMLVPVTVAYAWSARTWPRRLLFGLLFVGEALVLLLTQSRGALLGFVPALLVVAVGRDRRWVWLALVLGLVAAVGVALYGFQPSLELVADSFGESTIPHGMGRLELFTRGLYMLQDFPLTGIGLGAFPRILPTLYPFFLAEPGTDIPHVHNLVLQMGIDHGFPGLIAFLAFIILLGVMGVQSTRLSRGQPWQPLALGLLAGLVAYLFHGLVDAMSFLPRAHIFVWGYWGLTAAVWRWIVNHPAR